MTTFEKGKDSLIPRPSTLRRRPGNKAGNEAGKRKCEHGANHLTTEATSVSYFCNG